MHLGEWSVHSIDATLGLMERTVRIWQAEEHDSVRGNAVPSLGTSLILNQVDPSFGGWDGLVVVAVPLSHWNIKLSHHRAEKMQLRIVIIEDDDSRMVLHDLLKGFNPRWVCVSARTKQAHHLTGVLDRPILFLVPPVGVDE